MSELPPGHTGFLPGTLHPAALGERDAAAPATNYTVLGFDHDLHCCYATGPALGTLGIESRPLGADTQAVPPALRTILRSLCRCVFAGALAETEFDVGAQRLRLSGLPLLDSRGTISVALVRIVTVAASADTRAPARSEARPSGPAGGAGPPRSRRPDGQHARASGF